MNDLAHYGVKGMHWGVRRGSVESGRGKAPSHDALQAAKSARIAKRSGTKALDNKELQALVTRMNLEQQYSRLTAKPSKLKKGQDYVKTALTVNRTVNEAISFANSPSGKALREQLAKAKR